MSLGVWIYSPHDCLASAGLGGGSLDGMLVGMLSLRASVEKLAGIISPLAGFGRDVGHCLSPLDQCPSAQLGVGTLLTGILDEKQVCEFRLDSASLSIQQQP